MMIQKNKDVYKVSSAMPGRYWRIIPVLLVFFAQPFAETSHTVSKGGDEERVTSIFISNFNREISQQLPDFEKLAEIQTKTALDNARKGEEMEEAMDGRGSELARQLDRAIEAALEANDVDKARRLLDYCNTHSDYIPLPFDRLVTLEKQTQSIKTTREKIGSLDAELKEIRQHLAANRLAEARSSLKVMTHRFQSLGKNLSESDENQYERSLQQFTRTLKEKEDSLISVNMHILETKGKDAAIDYLKNDLSQYRIAHERLSTIDEAIVNYERMQQRREDSVRTAQAKLEYRKRLERERRLEEQRKKEQEELKAQRKAEEERRKAEVREKARQEREREKAEKEARRRRQKEEREQMRLEQARRDSIEAYRRERERRQARRLEEVRQDSIEAAREREEKLEARRRKKQRLEEARRDSIEAYRRERERRQARRLEEARRDSIETVREREEKLEARRRKKQRLEEARRDSIEAYRREREQRRARRLEEARRDSIEAVRERERELEKQRREQQRIEEARRDSIEAERSKREVAQSRRERAQVQQQRMEQARRDSIDTARRREDQQRAEERRKKEIALRREKGRLKRQEQARRLAQERAQKEREDRETMLQTMVDREKERARVIHREKATRVVETIYQLLEDKKVDRAVALFKKERNNMKAHIDPAVFDVLWKTVGDASTSEKQVKSSSTPSRTVSSPPPAAVNENARLVQLIEAYIRQNRIETAYDTFQKNRRSVRRYLSRHDYKVLKERLENAYKYVKKGR